MRKTQRGPGDCERHRHHTWSQQSPQSRDSIINHFVHMAPQHIKVSFYVHSIRFDKLTIYYMNWRIWLHRFRLTHILIINKSLKSSQFQLIHRKDHQTNLPFLSSARLTKASFTIFARRKVNTNKISTIPFVMCVHLLGLCRWKAYRSIHRSLYTIHHT